MSKIFVLGDIHGDYKPVRSLLNRLDDYSTKDTIILLGDSGFNFFFNYRDENLKQRVNNYGITIFAVRGNHEERPSNCMDNNKEGWHMETFWNNKVFVENKYPNIKYALDIPAIYEIPTKNNELPLKTLVLPGAYSVDKYYRLEKGWSWFKDEQLTEGEMEIGTTIAELEDWDLILSHTCPITYEPTDLFLSVIDQSTVDKTMEKWLDNIEKNNNYKLWIFGHYHNNRIYPKYNGKQMLMLFNDCYLDLYKYLCGNIPLNKCLKTTNVFTEITNLDF